LNTDIKKQENKEVILSFSEKNFADIILNFLGKKQKLSFIENEENFEIRRNDIEQFYFLLDEKIRKEHYTAIDYFAVQIQYNDKTQREIIGIEALKQFLETRDVMPTSIILTWNIILDFPDSQIIENQKIEISFDTDNNSILMFIEHTNQAWGIEVLNLFKDHIKTLIIQKPKKLIYAEKINSLFNNRGFSTFILLPIVIMTLILQIYTTYTKTHKDLITANSMAKVISIGIDENNTLETILAFYIVDKEYKNNEIINTFKSKKLKEEIEKYLNLKEKEKDTLLIQMILLILALPGIALGVFIYTWQKIKYFSTKSFILVTSKADNAYKSFYDMKSKIEYYSFSLIGISIVCSIIASILYQWIFS